MLHILSHPNLFTLTDRAGRHFRGGDQAWYRDDWQRKAGCGPTTAATVLGYLSAVHPALTALSPGGTRSPEDFLPYMEEIWDFVTPGHRGLDSVDRYTGGCQRFARSRGGALWARGLEIPGVGSVRRPPLAQCRQLLCTALDTDCPLAFLNFSNGDLTNLDSWHWVPLISLEETAAGALFCAVLDEGREKTVDFALWHRTTRLGGGLAVVGPETLAAQFPP